MTAGISARCTGKPTAICREANLHLQKPPRTALTPSTISLSLPLLPAVYKTKGHHNQPNKQKYHLHVNCTCHCSPPPKQQYLPTQRATVTSPSKHISVFDKQHTLQNRGISQVVPPPIYFLPSQAETLHTSKRSHCIDPCARMDFWDQELSS